jgi:potassium efflux system protein
LTRSRNATREYCGLEAIRTLFRPQGIALAHFRWSERTGRVVQRHLLWSCGLLVTGCFIVAMTHVQNDPLLRHSLGRLAFLGLMLISAALALCLLHPTKGLALPRGKQREASFGRRIRAVGLPLGVILPPVFGGMAAAGYYYTARQLEYRLIQTLGIILVGALAHAFCRSPSAASPTAWRLSARPSARTSPPSKSSPRSSTPSTSRTSRSRPRAYCTSLLACSWSSGCGWSG